MKEDYKLKSSGVLGICDLSISRSFCAEIRGRSANSEGRNSRTNASKMHSSIVRECIKNLLTSALGRIAIMFLDFLSASRLLQMKKVS